MTQTLLAKAMSEYVQTRLQDKLKKMPTEESELSNEQLQQKRIVEQKYELPTWISEAARRANQIKICTHVAKFSHPDSKGISIYDKNIGIASELRVEYLTSATLRQFAQDVSGNAAVLDVAKFLLLGSEDGVLIDRLQQGIVDDLLCFAESCDQAHEWKDKFLQVVEVVNPSSHTLSKQVYFPVARDGNEVSYHLLCPLHASSLAIEVQKRVEAVVYGEEAKATRELRKKKKYHDKQDISFPRTLIQKFGGTKPQNISMLNSKKGIFLFNSEPPTWKSSQDITNIKSSRSFWRLFERRTQRALGVLRSFVIRNRNRTSTIDIRQERGELVTHIIDTFIQLVSEIRSIDRPGWSNEAHLTDAEKILLDPVVSNESTITTMDTSQWTNSIAEQFARWFNKKLENKKMKIVLADCHYYEWRKLMLKELSYLSGEEL